jgi:hypothetical protein
MGGMNMCGGFLHLLEKQTLRLLNEEQRVEAALSRNI